MSTGWRIAALVAFSIIYWAVALYRLSIAVFSSTDFWPNPWGNSLLSAAIEATGFLAIYIGLMMVMARRRG